MKKITFDKMVDFETLRREYGMINAMDWLSKESGVEFTIWNEFVEKRVELIKQRIDYNDLMALAKQAMEQQFEELGIEELWYRTEIYFSC